MSDTTAAVCATASDHEWVERLQRGDANAFTRVFDAYQRRILAFLVRLCGRRHTAEDLAQETWLKFAKSARSLHEDTRLAPFLFTIARNSFLSHRRWAVLDVSRLVTFGLERLHAATTEDTPELKHERKSTLAQLESALREVPLASREV